MHTTLERIDPDLLRQELATAGIDVPGVGYSPTPEQGGGEVYTYDASGSPIDLPPEAEPVVDAHDPTPRAQAIEQQADLERLALVNERAQTDPAFAALAELALRGTQTGGG
jgi:hypothetical protein